MNLRDDEFPIRIRDLQGRHPEAHKAFINWGLYSRDRAGFQRGLTRVQIYNEYRWNEEDDGYASEGALIIMQTAPAKAEKALDEPYDEKAGTILDERIHGPGGLMVDARPVIKVAYVFRDIPEFQYPHRTGLHPDHVAERLEYALKWAGGFV